MLPCHNAAIGGAVPPVNPKVHIMSTKQTTTPKAATKAAATKAAAKAPSSPAKAPQVANPMPTPAAPVVPSMVPAKPASSPRGLPVAVRLNPASKGYRTTAPHCLQRWQALLAAMQAGGGVAQVAPLVGACTQGAAAHNYNGPGVPGHFVGYALRRGYIVAA